jgi:L-fuconolactonase
MSSSSEPLDYVDAHVHFWDPARFRYAWMAEAPALQRAFLPRDLFAAGGERAPRSAIFVQAECVPEQSRAEAEWVLELAAAEPRITGLVVRAALERGAEALRAELAPFAREPKVQGVRRLIQWESDPEFCVRRDFVAATRSLAERDLACDLCIYARQLPALIELVRQCPDVRFVLDHLGKPEVKAGQLDPWREDLRRLAGFENVVCKISGLATEADHAAWTSAQLRPYLDHARACFGVDRLVFGSDWPVATLALDYGRWVGEVAAWSASWSEQERELLWRQGAARLYRMRAPAS